MEKYRKFEKYHIFAPVDAIGRYKKETILRFHKSKKDDSIIVVKNLFGDIINISLFGMASEESVA